MLRRLLRYMLLILLIAALVLWSCQAIFGQFATTYDNTRQLLSTQLDYYEIQLKNHCEQLAADGISLSNTLSAQIEAFLKQKSLAFSAMSDRQTLIHQLESLLCDALLPAVQEADNSGVFFLLDMIANSALSDAETSRSGVYLRASGRAHGRSINLFRGSSQLAQEKKISVHNKWKLEFDTNIFPDYDTIREHAVFPPESSYYFTKVLRLPGTWEQIRLLTVPIFGEDGSYYGICGFEVSQNLFKELFQQPSALEHLSVFTCSVPETDRTARGNGWDGARLDPQSGMTAGTTGGYYTDIKEVLTVQKLSPGLASRLNFFNSRDPFAASGSGSLLKLKGTSDSFVGMCRTLRLSPLGSSLTAVVCIPEYDYTHLRTQNTVNMLLIVLLLLLLGTCACVFFSRRFVQPILRSMEAIRRKERDWQKSHITEIDDLMDFLADADRRQDAALADAQNEINALRRAAANTAADPSALRQEPLPAVDPERLQFFLDSLETLSPAERRVFDLYVEGYKAAQIADQLCLSINTVKTHNAHIYEKLAVSSRKELLLYIRHMQDRPQSISCG